MSIATWAFIRGAHLLGNDFVDCTAVSAEEVDAYLRDLEEKGRISEF